MNNTLQKLRMFRGMLNGQHADAGPAYVTLDLTRRCNTLCVGCYFHCVQEREPTPGDHSVQDLPVELLCRLATELAGVGTSEIVLLGEGEPLLCAVCINEGGRLSERFLKKYEGRGRSVRIPQSGAVNVEVSVSK